MKNQLYKDKLISHSKKISKKLASQLKNDIASIILHGSVLTSDFSDKLSDLDMVIVVRKKSKKLENEIFDIIHNTKEYVPVQALIYSKSEFIKSLKKGVSVQLSCTLKGKCLYDNSFFERIKTREHGPTSYTRKILLLNAYSALGLVISDFSQQMFYDSINSAYHAARNSIWAILLHKEPFPDNKRIVDLLNQIKYKEILEKYKKILSARSNPDIFDYEIDNKFDKKFFRKGFYINKLGLVLKNAEDIVRSAWEINVKKRPLSFNGCLNLLKYIKAPRFSSIHLSVDHKSEKITYNLFFPHNENYMFIEIDGMSGGIKKEVIPKGVR